MKTIGKASEAESKRVLKKPPGREPHTSLLDSAVVDSALLALRRQKRAGKRHSHALSGLLNELLGQWVEEHVKPADLGLEAQVAAAAPANVNCYSDKTDTSKERARNGGRKPIEQKNRTVHIRLLASVEEEFREFTPRRGDLANRVFWMFGEVDLEKIAIPNMRLERGQKMRASTISNFPDELHNRLKMISSKRGCTMNALINGGIKAYTELLKSKKRKI
jgi:hypothetical protein